MKKVAFKHKVAALAAALLSASAAFADTATSASSAGANGTLTTVAVITVWVAAAASAIRNSVVPAVLGIGVVGCIWGYDLMATTGGSVPG